jgi:hypothetical protein
MKARQFIDEASFDDRTRKAVDRAFDEAWAVLGKKYRSPLATEAARLKLANIVVSLVREGERDAGRLREAATARLRAMAKPGTSATIGMASWNGRLNVHCKNAVARKGLKK